MNQAEKQCDVAPPLTLNFYPHLHLQSDLIHAGSVVGLKLKTMLLQLLARGPVRNFWTKLDRIYLVKLSRVLTTIAVLFFCGQVSQAQTFNYGTGSIASNTAPFNAIGGAGIAVSGNDITVTANVSMVAGTYNFANMTINAGITVTVTGTGAPLIIRCTGTFTNNGILHVNGANGTTAGNGTTVLNPTPIVVGIAGGGNSGRGGGPSGSSSANRATVGSPFGSSTGGGRTPCNSATYTVPSWGGPGGGGGTYAGIGNGGTGGAGQGTGCTVGGGGGTGTYGNPTLTSQAGAAIAFFSSGQTAAGDRWILGGSGGAGGAGTQSFLAQARGAGGSGGAGAGGVQISANSIVVGTNGIVRARGGNGGNGNLSLSSNAAGGGGGGGTGGTINLQYMSSYVQNNANAVLRLDVRGGLGGFGPFGTTGTGGDGGNGGAGRLLVEQDVMLCTPPATSADNFSATSITTNAATLNWTRGDGDEVIVIVREGAAVSGGGVGGNSYIGSGFYSGGNALGGGFVVYVGSGTSVSVTGLPNLNTTYHVAVIEYFTAGGGCYEPLVDAMTGSFATANGAMTYLSSTTVQQTGPVAIGTANAPVVRVEVVGGPGTAPALSLSSLTFNTNGSTAVPGDITSARVYYTGASTTFNTSVPFGAAVTGFPGGSNPINVGGTQALVPGSNYFWVVFNVSISASTGNVLDAECTSINAGGAQTPTITAPASNRPISGLGGLDCGFAYSNTPPPSWLSIFGGGGTIDVASGTGIDDQQYPSVSLGSGFVFNFNGTDFTSIGVNANGFVWFGAYNPPTGNVYNPISTTLPYAGIISALGADVRAHSAASTTPRIMIQTTGTAPNRVVTIEWLAFMPFGNTGGFCTLLGSPTDWNRYDFQIKLHENGGTLSNVVEIIHRDMNAFCVDGNALNAQVGLRGATNADFRSRSGTGNTSNTSHAEGTLNTNTILHGASNFFSATTRLRYTPTIVKPTTTPGGIASNNCPNVDALLSTTSPAPSLQWYLNGAAIDGATSSSYTATTSGAYVVLGMNGLCGRVSDPIVVTIVSYAVPISPNVATSNTCPSNSVALSTTATAPSFQWYRNTVAISGATGSAHSALLSGSYEVEALFGGGCNVLSAAVAITIGPCGPAPTNDQRIAALLINSWNLGTCISASGTLVNATNSPESNSAEITGEDVWYRFTAASPGVRIVCTTTSFNGIIELQDAAGNTLDTENVVSGLGTEMMNYYDVNAPLISGSAYYIVVRNYNSAQGTGTFDLCVQRIRATGCDSGPGPFTPANNFKADWVGAWTYTFTFTNTITLQQYILSSTGGITLVPLASLPQGATYNVSISCTYHLADGNAMLEFITVPVSSVCQMSMAAPPAIPNIFLRVTDQCVSGPRTANAIIGANVWQSGALNYQWRFQQVAPVSGLWSAPVAGAPTNRFLNLFPVGLTPGGTYNVEIRALYSGGIFTNWGPTQCLQIIGPGGMILEQNEEAQTLKTMPTSEEMWSAVIYPNPSAGDQLMIALNGIESEQLTIRVLDATGRMIDLKSLTIAASGTWNIVPLHNLSSGVYFVEIVGNAERKTMQWVVSN